MLLRRRQEESCNAEHHPDCLAAILLAGSALPAFARDKPIEPAVDTPGSVGGYTSITVGADGLGLVSYLDNLNGYFKAAHCANVLCTTSTAGPSTSRPSPPAARR